MTVADRFFASGPEYGIPDPVTRLQDPLYSKRAEPAAEASK